MTAHKVVKRDFQVPLLPLSKKNVNNWVKFKQWPLAPNSPKWRITRANVSNASLILANVGECIECRMCRVRGKGLANVWRMYRVRGKWLANVWRMYRVRAKGLANVWRMYRVRAK